MENEYQLREVTPKILRCLLAACPAIYEGVRDVGKFDCAIIGCPGIYEAKDCIAGIGCPDIKKRGNVYLIIGKQVDPKDAGLEKKVGSGEVLIEVPRELIGGMER